MRIGVLSLSGHRIDNLLAEYIVAALHNVHNLKIELVLPEEAHECDRLIITNGLNDSERSKMLVELAKTIPTYYIYDDCYLPTFSHMTTVSQFTNLGDIHFQVSELSVFDKRWDEKHKSRQKFKMYYGGHVKPQRDECYKKYLINDESTLIIGDYTKYVPKATHKDYTRDMNELYTIMNQATYTIVFGDEDHNGVNLPLRIYEAAMMGLVVYVDRELIGDQKFMLEDTWRISCKEDIKNSLYSAFKKSLLGGTVEDARRRVRKNLINTLGVLQWK